MRRVRDASIVLHAAEGELRVAVRIPEPEMHLADLAAIACALTQAIADRSERRELEAGRPITGRAGCGDCCRQPVPISAPEALLLADAIDRLEPASRGDLPARFAVADAECGRRSVALRLAQARGSGAALRLLANEYFARRLACPFLVDEACSIHPLRPVPGRSAWPERPGARGDPCSPRIEAPPKSS
jgi:hypothetical protein